VNLNQPHEPTFVVLDRDGTLIDYVPYLRSQTDLRLHPRAGQAVARLNAAGVIVAVITNQSIVGRGVLSEQRLDEIHSHMLDMLAREGAFVQGIYVCPHSADSRCDCRKPNQYLMDTFLRDWVLDASGGYVVGDNISDIELALGAGATPLHVQTGVHSQGTVVRRYPEIVSVGDIGDAVEFILGEQP